MTININDKIQIDEALDKSLGENGLRRGAYPNLFGQQVVIDTPLTLYVATTGSDSNPGTQNLPFATIQAAINSLDRLKINAPVVVSVGAGTFDGFIIQDVNIGYSAGASGAYLAVEGTLSAVETGTPTSEAVSTLLTITDTTKTWTVDQFMGDLIEVTTSNGAFTTKIATNTATTITTTLNITGILSYRVMRPQTIITGNIPSGAAVPSGGTTLTTFTNACIVVSSSVNGQTPGQIALRRLSVLPTVSTTEAFIVRNSQCIIDQCYATRSVGNVTLLDIRGISSVMVARSGFYHPLAGAAINLNAASSLVNLDLRNSSVRGLSGTTSNLILINSGYTGISALCYFSGASVGFRPTGVDFSISSCIITGCTTGIFCTQARIISTLNQINSCTTAISLASGSTLTTGSGSGSGNTTAYSITTGSRCQIASGNTMTGTTEISVDGSTTTLAAFRALSPKAFPAAANVYGSYVYE